MTRRVAGAFTRLEIFSCLCGLLVRRASLTLLALAGRVPPRPAIRARADFGSLLCKSGSLALEAASWGLRFALRGRGGHYEGFWSCEASFLRRDSRCARVIYSKKGFFSGQFTGARITDTAVNAA